MSEYTYHESRKVFGYYFYFIKLKYWYRTTTGDAIWYVTKENRREKFLREERYRKHSHGFPL